MLSSKLVGAVLVYELDGGVENAERLAKDVLELAHVGRQVS
jgi:hypothetical protein